MGWPPTAEIARAAGSAIGLIGFSLMDGAMRIPWGKILERIINGRAKQIGADE